MCFWWSSSSFFLLLAQTHSFGALVLWISIYLFGIKCGRQNIAGRRLGLLRREEKGRLNAIGVKNQCGNLSRESSFRVRVVESSAIVRRIAWKRIVMRTPLLARFLRISVCSLPPAATNTTKITFYFAREKKILYRTQPVWKASIFHTVSSA